MTLTMDVATGEVLTGAARAKRAGCARDRPIPAGATGINVCNWGFEWTLSDSNCDGIDQDGNGIPDDGPGSCLMRMAVVPHCFNGDDDAFEQVANDMVRFFTDSLGLSGCPNAVGAVLTFPSSMPGGVVPCRSCAAMLDLGTFHGELAADLSTILDPNEWSVIAAVTDRDLCGEAGGAVVKLGPSSSVVGFSDKTIWAEHTEALILSHEIGHLTRLEEEYCSEDRGGRARSCNDASSINALAAANGCDPATCCSAAYRSINDTDFPTAPDPNLPCADPTAGHIICCAGNRAADISTGTVDPSGGRCIMSHVDADGPRGWCPACLGHWRSSNYGLGAPLTCASAFQGLPPVITWSVSLPSIGPARVGGFSEGLMRPGLHSPGTSGEFRIEARSLSGALLYEGFRDVGGENYDFPNDDPNLGRYRLQAIVSEEVLGTPVTLRVYRGAELSAQTTFNGIAPVPSFQPTVVECNRQGGADFMLDASASSDADGDTLHFEWTSADLTVQREGVTVPAMADGLGPASVTLSVTDGFHITDLTQDVLIEDTLPPEIVLADNPPVPVCSILGEPIQLAEPQVTDVCSEVILEGRVIASTNPNLVLPMLLDAGQAVLPVGSHTVEWIATDGAGNSNSATQVVDVIPALYATNALELRDRSQLTRPGGLSGAASAGNVLSWVGVEARLADLWSIPPIELRDRAVVGGEVRSSGAIVRGNDVSISGGVFEQQPLGLPAPPSITPSFPAPSGGNVHLEPHTSRSIAADSYGTIHVKTGGVLSLSEGGNYFVRQLILEPDAAIQASGKVTFFVESQIIDRGRFLGFEESAITYMGTTPFFLEAPLVAQVFAPRGALVVRGNVRTGQILARDLSVDAGWIVECDGALRMTAQEIPPSGTQGGCNEAAAIDLGPTGNETSVSTNACVKVTNYPGWWATRNMQLQTMAGGTYPVPFEWTNTCAGSGGTGAFTGEWQQQVFGPASSQCATLIRLLGLSTGQVTLRYYAQ